MKILRKITVPTGEILVVAGAHGKLEMISVGDYGKDVNVKADFLGITNVPPPVRHTKLLPLTQKWVITISTQYGCAMNCEFCDVPKAGSGKNATFYDLTGQVLMGLRLHPEITSTDRLNIHFARMGEPTWNPNVLDCAKWLHEHINPEYAVHPVVSTMMPKHNEWLKTFIHTWMRMKNRLYGGNAGLQISINSTHEVERIGQFSNNAHSLVDISRIMDGIMPCGRKIALNFAVADYEINPRTLLKYFPPELYMIKLTPMHKTNAAISAGIETAGDYTSIHPYKHHEKALTDAGYDVLVFIASIEEDLGCITCGNAIIGGSQIRLG